MTTTTIRPGILVALRSSVDGGVVYRRTDLAPEGEAQMAEGAAVARWETTKIVDDPAEHEKATKVRASALTEIGRVCVRTSFGLVATQANEGLLDEAHRKARAMIDEFNASARCTRVSLFMLKGRVASTDEEAARAIGAEVASLIGEMSKGIDRLDPEAIRSAARKALQIGAVLDEAQALTVDTAVQAARKAARAIVKRVQKEGEDAAVVLASIQRGDIERARISFLDVEEREQTAAPEEVMPDIDMQRQASIDFEPVNDPVPTPAPAPGAFYSLEF